MIAALASLAALLPLAEAPAAEAEVRRHLIVLGVNHSLDPAVEPLRFADDDAARYAELLGPGAASLSLLTVLDPSSQERFGALAAVAAPPTLANLERSARLIFGRMRDEQDAGYQTELVVIYVGHGAVDGLGQGYVTLLDGQLSRADLFDRLITPSPARFNHVIVDACSAYHLLNRGAADAAAVRALLDQQTLAAHPNTGVLLATSSDRATHEWSRIGGGVFSHQILSALSGAADVDGDGLLRYPEVGAFVEAANGAVRDQRARIDLYLRPPLLHLEQPLWRLRREPGPRLELARAETGHLAVVDGRGLRVVEVNKNAEQPLRVALAGEAPFEISLDEVTLQLSAAQGVYALSACPPASEGPAPRAALAAALERGLYQVPFGRSYVEGYRARLLRELERAAATPAVAASPAGPATAPGALAEPAAGRAFPFAAVGLLGLGGLSAVGALAGGVLYGNAAVALFQGKGKITALEAQEHATYGNVGCALLGCGGCLSVSSLAWGAALLLLEARGEE